MSLPTALMGMNYWYKPGSFWESPKMNENKFIVKQEAEELVRQTGCINKIFSWSEELPELKKIILEPEGTRETLFKNQSIITLTT